MSERKWKYRVTQPMLPPGSSIPVMDYRQMENWLDGMDADGWEFVSYGQKRWVIPSDTAIQEWWIFRRRVHP